MMKRGSGVLLHITSLPSDYGIGDFGPEALRFAEFLSQAKQRYWQLLPLNPTDAIYGNSPYSSHSAFALNPLLVSPEALVEDGWLPASHAKTVPAFPPGKVDYLQVGEYKARLWEKAYADFKSKAVPAAFDTFCAREKAWLDDYALFVVLKRHFKNQGWNSWPQPLRERSPQALDEARAQFADELRQIHFTQYVLSKQWHTLKAHCRSLGVSLIGDIPIYVNYDSVDVWANPEYYKLKPDLTPEFVAGVPPDYFSQTGQRWGNPVYDWERLKAAGYGWWMSRMKHNIDLFDVVRIDHFRGLVNYWQIPASEPTAVNGQWVDGPKDDFLAAVKKAFPQMPIIAEDLGIITEEVSAVMERFGCPGMKVLLFAFGGDQATHPYQPHNYAENAVAYTGTHDNNTVMGWWQNEASDEERGHLAALLNKAVDEKHLAWDLVQVLLASRAGTVIFPLQDLLGLDASARMNVPGTTHDNWAWRGERKPLTAALAQKLRKATEKAGR